MYSLTSSVDNCEVPFRSFNVFISLKPLGLIKTIIYLTVECMSSWRFLENSGTGCHLKNQLFQTLYSTWDKPASGTCFHLHRLKNQSSSLSSKNLSLAWLLVLNDEPILSNPFSLKPNDIFSTEGADSNDFYLALPESFTPIWVLARTGLIFAAARKEHGQNPEIILYHLNLFPKGRGSRERQPPFRWQSSSHLSPYDKWRWQWMRPPVNHNISIRS